MNFRLTALMTCLAMANIVSAATEINLHRMPADYIANKLSTSANNKMKIEKVRVDVDFNGTSHTRIRQTYEGIPVWDATGVIHQCKMARASKNSLLLNNTNTTINGVIYEDLEKDLSHAYTSFLSHNTGLSALQVAKNLHIKKNRLAATTTFEKEKSLPIIFIDDNKQAHRAYLTSFTYRTSSSIRRPTAIVDAVTKKVYRSWEGILTKNPQETAAINAARAKLKKFEKMKDDDESPIIFESPLRPIMAGGVGGNPKLGELIYDGAPGNKPALQMKADELEATPEFPKLTVCFLENDDIKVLDMSYDGGDEDASSIASICIPNKKHNGVAWLSLNKGEKRWNDDEINEGYSPSLDAFYAATMTKNMYQDWFNVPALIDEKGKPMKLVMRTHFGRKYDNAFWDGDQMTFGDGGSVFYPLTSVSVTAHEISHGFTETHSDIDNSKLQMGALHESFSDMAAVAIEYYMTGKSTWDVGRDVIKNEGALRYLDHPTKDGSSIDHMKDFDEYDSECHAAAGITNKAFYLLATTKGWNVRKAFEVMTKANMHYWNSSMNTLADAACGVLSATKDYGYSIADVRVAFSKVGIDSDQCDVS